MKPTGTKIGGFFPLAFDPSPHPSNFFTLWNATPANSLLFHNGRSALHYLLQQLSPKTVWLPAYSCPSLAEAATGFKTAFFPLTTEFSQDIAFLEKNLQPGDAVVAIDYFGRNPAKAFRDFVAHRNEIHWIEDRAQALLPDETPWGDYILYSPRKLLGAPDGGILVSRKAALLNPHYEQHTDSEFMLPALMRYEDKEEAHNAVWYRSYQQQEERMRVSLKPMSRLTRTILAATDSGPIIEKRIANYRYLETHLAERALLAPYTGGVPFGFPIKTTERKKLGDHLASKNIFAAHHWPELASPKAQFAEEHARADRMLTLPCDQRYGSEEMKFIVQAVMSYA